MSSVSCGGDICSVLVVDVLPTLGELEQARALIQRDIAAIEKSGLTEHSQIKVQCLYLYMCRGDTVIASIVLACGACPL